VDLAVASTIAAAARVSRLPWWDRGVSYSSSATTSDSAAALDVAVEIRP
jgi:hypothetical protein